MVSTLPSPVLNTDSVHADTAATVPADVFAPDHAGLKELDVSKEKKSEPAKEANHCRNRNLLIVYFVKPKSLHQPKVSSAYAGNRPCREHDFTHRMFPEAFEGFRIAFVSDLHYKAC